MQLSVGADEWLEGVKRYPTPMTSRLATNKPLGLIWHYAGGRGGPGYAEKLAQRIASPAPDHREASWHLIVAKDGAIYQSAPFDRATWHVGLPGEIAGQKWLNVNRVTVGVELENAGRLRKLRDDWYCWPYVDANHEPLPSCLVEPSRAVITGEGAFDAFTDDQEATAVALVRALAERYGWGRDVCSYGHVDFRPPSGKEDPGPVWRQRILPRVIDAAFSGRATP